MLAYMHTIFSGFVPCRIIGRDMWRGVSGDPQPATLVRITATRGPYKRGSLEWVHPDYVMTRPLRVSRQSLGKLYGFAISRDTFRNLPNV